MDIAVEVLNKSALSGAAINVASIAGILAYLTIFIIIAEGLLLVEELLPIGVLPI